ncbi:MAG: carboxypeptidase regulatory-like domain-containing protein [Blastocatellia bacterium]|nr:carboxypeptidase regulatory-like domain-containing protein [Blastocatellia bacterium]
MPLFSRCFLLIFLGGLVAVSLAQSPAQRATGSIAGRVTLEGQPAAGVEVVLKPTGDANVDIANERTPPRTATTDAEGRYRMANLAAGLYRINVHAPAHVVAGDSANDFEAGKRVNLADNETAESVNFELTRGGVITGKVIDQEGHPVIAEVVHAFRLDEQGKRGRANALGSRFQTDDRGVYRIFGLEAGRYLVGAGASADDGVLRMSGGGFFRRTWHPDAVEEAKAKIVEVRPGGVAEEVDIRMARAAKAFAASGRVIEAETGKPVAGLTIAYAVTKKGSFSIGIGAAATNSQGEFRLEGLTPNSYSASTVGLGGRDLYAEPVEFEIVSGDVSDLEIKLGRAATISGTVVLEGATDPAIRAQLQKIELQPVSPGASILASMGTPRGTINADGTFRLGGVRPGKAQIFPFLQKAPPGFSLARTEWNGAEVKEIEVAPGEQTTGVRLIFNYGTASIAGRVEVKGGALPPGARLMVSLRREDESGDDFWRGKTAAIDARNQFKLEGVAQGNYRLMAKAFDEEFKPLANISPVEQPVAVAGGEKQEVTLVFDVTKKGGAQ